MKKKITVTTLPNGYAVKIDEKEYMYFSVADLIKGMCIHAGLGRKSPLSVYNRDALLKAMSEGATEQKLQEEVDRLRTEVYNLRNRQNENKKEQEGDKGEEGLCVL